MAVPDLISFGRGSYGPHELETTAREAILLANSELAVCSRALEAGDLVLWTFLAPWPPSE